MKIYKTTKGLENALQKLRAESKSIGLVPTMGALHAGHLSLVKRCVEENDVCVVSVFVNPTQFNNQTDLEKYPRTLEADAALLAGAKCTIMFAPSVKQIYPKPDTRVFDFGQLDKVMEGVHRPGHFNGVGQVVSRLFDIVKPGKAYFGEKDYQQLAIIRKMVKDYKYPIQIVGCPIVREKDGMALSSRNMRLSKDERKRAVRISQTLFKSVEMAATKSLEEVKQWVIDEINKDSILNVEYYEIVNSETMQSVKSWKDADKITGCITVYCGEVRLIDNIQYKK
ncbi:MAG: pantoate--beta-alanine ligase [Paludibacteraceae bacterium]|nr:pantoate--beta-alanine ligase [Paludibacteraceae bacterium]MCR5498690.1 pantoate--beta-alanine ligase [Paludibacteraceae bacterium]